MADEAPLSTDDIASRISHGLAADATGLVLAVSGGPDSMALLHLVAGLRGIIPLPPITVATVDHGLRPDAADDAAFVVRAAATLGLSARHLVWSGPKPARAIQERARAARYRLLTALCGTIGADHLVTAHTLDDQAETVLFRLLRGSGLAGLGGMAALTRIGGVALVRPLLDIAKARLVATCRARGVAYLDDPSNRDPRFARARLRHILPVLADEGLDARGLGRLALRLRRADAALDLAAAEAFAACRIDAAGLVLDGVRLVALPHEIMIRVLALIIAEAGGEADRLDRLERLAERIGRAAADGATMRATLGGMLLTLLSDGRLTLAREPRRRRGSTFVAPLPLTIAATIDACGNDGVEGFPWQG